MKSNDSASVGNLPSACLRCSGRLKADETSGSFTASLSFITSDTEGLGEQRRTANVLRLSGHCQVNDAVKCTSPREARLRREARFVVDLDIAASVLRRRS